MEAVSANMAVTIGRSDENDIQLLDPKVSRYHCKIEQTLRGIMFNDLHSKNGSYINGKKSESAALTKGDILKIGDHILSLTSPEIQPVTFPEKTMEFNAFPRITPKEEQTRQLEGPGRKHLFRPAPLPLVEGIRQPRILFFFDKKSKYWEFFQRHTIYLSATIFSFIAVLLFLYSLVYDKNQQLHSQEIVVTQVVPPDARAPSKRSTASPEDKVTSIQIAREAHLLLETGEYSHAITLFQKALGHDSKNILAQEGLAEAHGYIENLATICFSKGQLQLQAFKYREAITEFETVTLLLKDRPNHKLFVGANKLISQAQLRVKK